MSNLLLALSVCAVSYAADDPPAASPPASGESTPPADAGSSPPASSSGVDEDALFGAAPAPAPTAAAPGTTDLGDVQIKTTSDADILSRLGLADERITIGGKLYLRGAVTVNEDTSFAKTAYSSPNLLDLFADVRPNDRVRGFASARLKYDFTVADGDTDAYGNARSAGGVTLDQLWLKFDVAHRVYVTAGRQRIKWGSGRFWNPTDFMNQQTLDALNATVFDERTGVTLLKVHVPIEAIGANLYGVANFDGASTFGKVGGALRTEWVLGPSEVALTAAARNGDPLRLGADVSAGLGPLDVHVEGAVKHGDKSTYYKGRFDIDALPDLTVADFISGAAEDQLVFPTEVDRSDDWIPQVVAGAELGIKVNDDDTVYVGAEYFYNGGGYTDDARLLPWLLLSGAYQPFYTGQQYAGVYVAIPSPGRWDDASFTVSTLGNLSDRTFVSRLDASTKVNTFLSVNAYGSLAYGENGEFHFGYHLDPNENIDPTMLAGTDFESFGPILADGLDIPAPIATFGVGAQVNF
jgi:hypothetical protein